MSRTGGAGLGLLLLTIAGALLAWNVSRFIGAEATVRTKELAFLPSPAMAEVLSLGHRNSVAKLRWIDSFAYFEYQLERHDDHIEGSNESGFRRLYDALLDLDPRFLPFYEHAMLNTGGVLKDHQQALSYILGGLLYLPHETQLWRMAAAEMTVNYRMEEINAASFDAFLSAWEAAENDDDGRQMVRDWKIAVSRRRLRGLEQLPYWLTQLSVAKPGSPTARFCEDSAREVVAIYQTNLLQQVADRAKGFTGIAPDPACLVDPALVTALHPMALPPHAPWRIHAGRLDLRTDPFGDVFTMDPIGGKVIARGYQRWRFDGVRPYWTNRLEAIAKQANHWPADLAEADRLGLGEPRLPWGGRWVVAGKTMDIDWGSPAPPVPALADYLGLSAAPARPATVP